MVVGAVVAGTLWQQRYNNSSNSKTMENDDEILILPNHSIDSVPSFSTTATDTVRYVSRHKLTRAIQIRTNKIRRGTQDYRMYKTSISNMHYSISSRDVFFGRKDGGVAEQIEHHLHNQQQQ